MSLLILLIKIMIKLEELRKEKGLKQKELANMLDVAPPLISQWETSKIPISRYKINKLCSILGCKREDLLNGSKVKQEIEEIPQHVRYNISHYLELKGKNQSWLGKQLGITRSAVSAFLLNRKGDYKQGSFSLDKISELLGIKKSDLINRTPFLKMPECQNPAYILLRDKIVNSFNLEDNTQKDVIKHLAYFWVKSHCEGNDSDYKDFQKVVHNFEEKTKTIINNMNSNNINSTSIM